jgi:hypothetical protein
VDLDGGVSLDVRKQLARAADGDHSVAHRGQHRVDAPHLGSLEDHARRRPERVARDVEAGG